MKKTVFGGIFAGVAIVIILVLRVVISDTSESTEFVYHVLLADPENYENGVYLESFSIAAGNYKFKFIPNGDSPQMLSISLEGESYSFYEDFRLEGTVHTSPISEYYTWDYLGQKEIQIPQGQTLRISINPNGNLVGTVSVMIVR
jgi:hypothetical protein